MINKSLFVDYTTLSDDVSFIYTSSGNARDTSGKTGLEKDKNTPCRRRSAHKADCPKWLWAHERQGYRRGDDDRPEPDADRHRRLKLPVQRTILYTNTSQNTTDDPFLFDIYLPDILYWSL